MSSFHKGYGEGHGKGTVEWVAVGQAVWGAIFEGDFMHSLRSTLYVHLVLHSSILSIGNDILIEALELSFRSTGRVIGVFGQRSTNLLFSGQFLLKLSVACRIIDKASRAVEKYSE